MANKWSYECDCRNCTHLQFVDDPENHRHGEYCIPGIQGKQTVHADDDYKVRCDHYCPKATQMSLF